MVHIQLLNIIYTDNKNLNEKTTNYIALFAYDWVWARSEVAQEK